MDGIYNADILDFISCFVSIYRISLRVDMHSIGKIHTIMPRVRPVLYLYLLGNHRYFYIPDATTRY